MNCKFFSIVFVLVFMGSITAMELELKETGTCEDEKVKEFCIVFDPKFPQDKKTIEYYLRMAMLYRHCIDDCFYISFPARIEYEEASPHAQDFGQRLYHFCVNSIPTLRVEDFYDRDVCHEAPDRCLRYVSLKSEVSKKLLLKKAKNIPGIASLDFDCSWLSKKKEHLKIEDNKMSGKLPLCLVQ